MDNTVSGMYRRFCTSPGAAALFGWGLNSSGQLGLGDTENRFEPVCIDNRWNWNGIAAEIHMSFAIHDGKAYAFGTPSSVQDPATRPTTIDPYVKFQTVGRVSDLFVAGLTEDGILCEWLHSSGGSSLNKMNGAGNIVWKTTSITELVGAIDESGRLFTKGSNYYGQTGHGDAQGGGSRDALAQVGEAANWCKISCAMYAMYAINNAGELFSCGYGVFGRLGLGSLATKTVLNRVGEAANWTYIASNLTGSAAAINSLGELWMWGLNSSGQLGLGDTENRLIPTRVGTASNWISVSCGGGFTAAINNLGELWMWGLNSSGQLGLGDTENRLIPTRVGTASSWISVSCGYNHTIATKYAF